MRLRLLATLFSFAWITASAQQPVTVDLCTLLAHPHQYDKKAISVRAKVSYGFEDFTLVSECDLPRTTPEIWLMYGGTEPSGSISTINDHASRHGKNLEIDGKEVLLRRDESFRQFKRDIATLLRTKDAGAEPRYSPAYRVTAVLTGIFLAGNKDDKGMGGYGHLGCCRLLVIQQVDQVEAVAIGQHTGGSRLCQPYNMVDDAESREIGSADVDAFLLHFISAQVNEWTGHPLEGLTIVEEKDKFIPKEFSTYSIKSYKKEVGRLGLEHKKGRAGRTRVQVNWMDFLDCQ